MKIAGIILIVFSGAGLGICKSLELSRREKILEQLEKMILLLKNQIRCTGDTIPDALLEVAGKMSGEYREFLLSTSGAVQKRNGNTFGEIFKDCARELLPLSKVSEEERGCFLSIGERLGYLDREMQVAQLSLLEADMDRCLSSLRRTMKEKKKLYQNMGIMGGIFLARLMW